MAHGIKEKRLRKLEAQIQPFLTPRQFWRLILRIPWLTEETGRLYSIMNILSMVFFLIFGLAGSIAQWNYLLLPRLSQWMTHYTPDSAFWWLEGYFPFLIQYYGYVLVWFVVGFAVIIVGSFILSNLVVWILCLLTYCTLFVLLFPFGKVGFFLTEKFHFKSPILVLGGLFLVIGLLLQFVKTFFE